MDDFFQSVDLERKEDAATWLGVELLSVMPDGFRTVGFGKCFSKSIRHCWTRCDPHVTISVPVETSRIINHQGPEDADYYWKWLYSGVL